mmetsp:Transcript_27703/g.71295  ORF Transcript_27703/g.71295 Transcript_27703/m.71295 type:complete len:126 (+) Transcript_27703:626-1003(+)|eukprot:jgi/Tetstr1/461124/TSEL_006263.t1
MEALQPSGHPVAAAEFQAEVGGHPTDFVVAAYEDQIMVTASQLDTFGSVLHARQEKALDGDPTFSVTVLLGRREEPALMLCARGLVERLAEQGCQRPLLLMLGFKEHSPAVAKAVIKEVMQHRVW